MVVTRKRKHQPSNALSRRLLLATAFAVVLPGMAIAQGASPFVGIWKGEIPGIGDAELTISAVRPNGRIDGSMRFASQQQILQFGERLDVPRGISEGTVKGSSLGIETAMGGSYQFNLVGNEMKGTYRRGSTYNVPVSFKRS